MKKNFLAVLLCLIIFMGFAEQNKRRLISYSDNKVVYVIPGTTTYHTPDCKLLSTQKTGMMLSYARENNFKPCEVCFFEEVAEETFQPAPVKAKAESPKDTSAQLQIASPVSTGGFRGMQWGELANLVQKNEKSKLLKKETIQDTGLEIIAYSGEIAGRECIIGYYFAANQLVEGRYIFLAEHANKNLYIGDFDNIKNSLIEKYGKPSLDEKTWNNNLYKSDPGEWGMALSVGHLTYIAAWTTNDAEIQLVLKGDNYDISLILDYKSTAHSELIKKAASEAKKKIW